MTAPPTTRQRALALQLEPTIRKAAKAVAGRFRVSRDELLATGYLAAEEVARTFDPTRHDDIRAFGYARISGEMIDFAAKERRSDARRLIQAAHRFGCKASGLAAEVDPFETDESVAAQAEAACDVLAATIAAGLGATRPERTGEEEVVGALEGSRLHRALERAMKSLDEEKQRLVDLIFFEERLLEDAARALGLSERTARRRKKDALEALKRALVQEVGNLAAPGGPG